MGEGTGEKPLRTKSPRGQGGGARVLVRVLPPYRVPRSFLKPQQEDVGWAPALAGKEGGTEEARRRKHPCHEPHTGSLPKDLSRGNHRAGSIPTSPATRPESQAWPGPPGAKCLQTTSHTRLYRIWDSAPTGWGLVPLFCVAHGHLRGKSWEACDVLICITSRKCP